MNKSDAVRAFKLQFVTPLISEGDVPADVAWRAVDMAHHFVEETEKRSVEAAIRMGDPEEDKLMMAIAAKMLAGLSNAMMQTLEAVANDDVDMRARILDLLAQPGMTDTLAELGLTPDTIKDIVDVGTDPVTAMLAKAGVHPTEADAVIVSRTQDPADCDCENCAFVNKVKAVGRAVPLEMGFVAYVLPKEEAQRLMGEAGDLTATAVGVASIH